MGQASGDDLNSDDSMLMPHVINIGGCPPATGLQERERESGGPVFRCAVREGDVYTRSICCILDVPRQFEDVFCKIMPRNGPAHDAEQHGPSSRHKILEFSSVIVERGARRSICPSPPPPGLVDIRGGGGVKTMVRSTERAPA